MEKIIRIAINKTVLEHEQVTIDLPETAKFYFRNDDGNFFPKGFMLFAIIPRYKSNPTKSYMIYEISRNNQESTDFVPTDDCSSESFLKHNIRKTALEIIRDKYPHSREYNEITEDAFLTIREDLLSIENLTID